MELPSHITWSCIVRYFERKTDHPEVVICPKHRECMPRAANRRCICDEGFQTSTVPPVRLGEAFLDVLSAKIVLHDGHITSNGEYSTNYLRRQLLVNRHI